MPDYLLQENTTPSNIVLQEEGEPILLESSLTTALNNFKFVSSPDGISVSEKTFLGGALN